MVQLLAHISRSSDKFIVSCYNIFNGSCLCFQRLYKGVWKTHRLWPSVWFPSGFMAYLVVLRPWDDLWSIGRTSSSNRSSWKEKWWQIFEGKSWQLKKVVAMAELKAWLTAIDWLTDRCWVNGPTDWLMDASFAELCDQEWAIVIDWRCCSVIRQGYICDVCQGGSFQAWIQQLINCNLSLLAKRQHERHNKKYSCNHVALTWKEPVSKENECERPCMKCLQLWHMRSMKYHWQHLLLWNNQCCNMCYS